MVGREAGALRSSQFPLLQTLAEAKMGTSTDVVRGRATAPDQRQTIVVEFARLSAEQQAFVDLHTLRAVGKALPAVDTDGVVVEFWLREGDTAPAVYDDIRGWAIGNGLPIRGLVEL
jgi:hypothetical protein